MEKEGFEVTYGGVDKYGRVNPKDIEKAVKRHNSVSIMCEQQAHCPKDRKSQKRKAEKGIFFTRTRARLRNADFGHQKLRVDLMTINGSKIRPKAQAYYLKTGIKIEPVIYGGGQEENLRGGAETCRNNRTLKSA